MHGSCPARATGEAVVQDMVNITGVWEPLPQAAEAPDHFWIGLCIAAAADRLVPEVAPPPLLLHNSA
jgi:hypothetical protein